MQEAYARAWRSWDRVSRMDRPVAWVYVVALNCGRRNLRTKWRSPVAAVPPSVTDSSGAIATRLLVGQALETLPPRQRLAVVLRYLGDLSTAEIAEAMGCAEGTVKSTLHAGLRAMRVEIGEETDADD